MQVFGSSPDETAYCRLYLNRETTADALTMMQPQLLAYTMEVTLRSFRAAADGVPLCICTQHITSASAGVCCFAAMQHSNSSASQMPLQAPPQPVLLDVTSIAPTTVLVLDSFFYVVVFHGTTVAQWRKAEYHLNPEHAAFAQLLEVWHLANLQRHARVQTFRFPSCFDHRCGMRLAALAGSLCSGPHCAENLSSHPAWTDAQGGRDGDHRASLPGAPPRGVRPERQPGVHTEPAHKLPSLSVPSPTHVAACKPLCR